MNSGDILVFESGDRKITFIFDKKSMCEEFLIAKDFSNTIYLTEGAFDKFCFNKANCRLANDSEKIKYFNISSSSPFNKILLTEFERRMYKVCEILGASPKLLSIIGSYKDTLSNNVVIEELDSWIKEHSYLDN